MNDVQLKKITGGGLSVWGGFAIAAIVVFLSGVIDGIVRPSICTD